MSLPDTTSMDQATALLEHFTAETLRELAGTLRQSSGDQQLVQLVDSELASRNGVEPDAGDTATRRRFEFLTVEELNNLPPQQLLIEGLLVRSSLANLFGQPASFKTVIALSMGLSIASGTDWYGHAVEQGPVVFCAAEGVSGLPKRISAWRALHPKADLSEFYIVPDVPRALQPADVEAFLAELPCTPVFTIVDTLSRSLEGGNENASEDMGAFIEMCDRVRRETEATVLVLHHSDKQGQWSRGHSSFLGAVQTEMEARLDGERRVTLKCRKQKDHEPFAPISLVRRIVELDMDGAETSVVLTADHFVVDDLTDAAKTTLDALAAFGAPGAAGPVWLDRTIASGVAKSSFYYIKSNLLDRRIVRQNGENFVAVQWSSGGPVESSGQGAPVQSSGPGLKPGLLDSGQSEAALQVNGADGSKHCWICGVPLGVDEVRFCKLCGEEKPI